MKEEDKFRYAEKCLYDYKKNMNRLKVLRDDLKIKQAETDVHAQSYENVYGVTGEPSDPVFLYVVSIETLELHIKRLERITTPITTMMEDLNSPEILKGSKKTDLLQILQLIYFGGNQFKKVIDELKLSKRTFARRRDTLVYLTIDYLGL